MGSTKVGGDSQEPLRPAGAPFWLLALGLLAVCGLTFGLRCLHVLNYDHYFVVSPDSHYFHRLAQLLVEGKTYFYPTHGQLLPTGMLPGGITYALAAVARAAAWLTPMSPGDSLELACKLLPPSLGVVTTLVIYVAVSRVAGRVAGLFSAFCWAVVPWGIVHQAAGYLDRDCLSILLVVSGVFLFYFLSDWQTNTERSRFMWLFTAVVVVGMELVLYVEWGFLGPAILVSILVGFFLLKAVRDVAERVVPQVVREADPLVVLLTLVRGSLRALFVIIKGPLGRTVAVVLSLNLLGAAFRPGVFREIGYYFQNVFGGALMEEQTVGELRPMAASDIASFWLLIIPASIGIYVCARRRNNADVLFVAWFAVLFVAGLFAVRFLIYAAPAVCILSGVGLAALVDVKGFRRSPRARRRAGGVPSVNPRRLTPYLRVGFAIFLISIAVLDSISFGYRFASGPPKAADDGWEDALLWLRDNTPRDAVIISWWDYGYWIFDMAQRVPVVDNGAHAEAADEDIRRLYQAAADYDAVETMSRYGAGYVVFSRVETRLFSGLEKDFGYGKQVAPEFRDWLYVRSYAAVFDSDTGLERVYPSAVTSDTAVVILALV